VDRVFWIATLRIADCALRIANPKSWLGHLEFLIRVPHRYLLALLVASACSAPTSRDLARAGTLRGANVLVVTIDTLREDRVGAYGNRSGLTPNLDRLAARGVRYVHAFTPAPLTLPAHASILTGLLPRHHGIHNNTSARLDQRVPTLASLLKGAGYRTGAFVGAFVLDGRFGLNRGFDEYNDHLPHGDRATFHFAERRAEEVVALAADWILDRTAADRSPWLAWVHLFDPHAPYDAPPAYRTGRTDYDAEVNYADAMIGRLIARLEAAQLLERTLIVVTADHGESLGEHGETTHGLFAYNATLSVPLIFSAPSIQPGEIEAPVSHVDLTPTITDLVGVTLSDKVDGESLARTPPRGRPIFFEALDASLTRGWAPLRGIVQDGWKYIDLPEAELYDLVADPSEQRNRVDRHEPADRLRRTLRTALESDVAAPRMALDDEAAARLRSLGYTAGTASSRKPITAADDPKRLVALNERFNAALTTFDQGRPREALADFLSITRERPDFAAARASAATVLVSIGDAPAAVDLLRSGLVADPESPELLPKLGTALRAAGDLRGSAAALERARRAGNDNPDVTNDLAIAYAGLGRPDAARAMFRELLDRNPAAATTWFNLGLFELQMRKPADAATAFRRAVDLEPSYGEAWQALGAALLHADKPGAVEAWRKAERLLPGDYDLLFNLAMVLADSGTPGEATPYLERFARDAPPAHYAEDIARVRATLARIKQGRP
jgi:arylsulfatase A-like enzyme/Flp pilus assembly protein TadD